jgi:hypothetical protein
VELNTFYHIYTLESVAHWYVDKAKLKVQKDWASKAADVKGNAYIIPVVSMDGNDRAHIRFEISGQKAWIAEWGRGRGAAKAAQRTVRDGVDLGSRNPYADQYRESAQFNPVRRQFNKAGSWDVYRRLKGVPYTDLDGNRIEGGSLSPKVLEPGYTPPKTGKKGRPSSAKTVAKVPESFQKALNYPAKHIVKNQLLGRIGTTEDTAAKNLYDFLASCAVNRVCKAIENAGGKRR